MAATDEPLASLYRDAVLLHSRDPQNMRRLEPADHQATGHNPLCGDRVTIYLRESGGIVTDVTFEATGCAISMASASMLTTMARGRPPAEIHRLVQNVTAAFDGSTGDLPGELAALASVRSYPARIRCATLAWRTLDAALADSPAPVSTE